LSPGTKKRSTPFSEMSAIRIVPPEEPSLLIAKLSAEQK
jgi:hypothetical protein